LSSPIDGIPINWWSDSSKSGEPERIVTLPMIVSVTHGMRRTVVSTWPIGSNIVVSGYSRIPAILDRRDDAGVVRLLQGAATRSAAWRAVKRW